MLHSKINGTRSFFNDILRNFILVLLVPMITIVLIFSYVDKIVREQVQKSASQNLDLYYEQMEDIMKDMRATCLSILENANCKMYSQEWMNNSMDESKLRQDVYIFLQNLIDIRYYDIFIYYERDGRCISGKHTSLSAERYYDAYYGENGRENHKEEFLKVVQTESKQLTSHVIRGYGGEEYLCMTLKPLDLNKNSRDYTICVVLSPEYLNGTLMMRGNDVGVFLAYNAELQLVLNNTSEFDDLEMAEELVKEGTENSIWIDKEEYMVGNRESKTVKNKYLYMVPYENFWDEVKQLRGYCFCGILFCLAISIYLSYHNARRTYNPIGDIVEFIHSKEETVVTEGRRQPEPDYIMSYIKSNESKLKEYKSGARELCLYNLLEGKEGSTDGAVLTKSGIEFPHKGFVVCLFEIEMALEKIADLRHFIIKNIFEELGNVRGRAYYLEFGKNRCALLVNLDGNIDDVVGILEEGQVFIKQHIILSVGLSSIHENMSELPEAYREAQEALRYRFLRGGGSQIHYKDVASRNLIRQSSGENRIYMLLLNYIKGETESCDVDDFVESLGYIYEINEEVSMNMANFFKDEVIAALSKIMLLNGYEEGRQKELAKELTATDTLIEFKQQLSAQIVNLCELNSYKKPRTDICAKTRSFIDENYSDTQLSVSMLGQKMGIQAAHLSKLFKEAYGISISDYIAGIRIQHAKRLIKEQHVSVQETAEKVGFISSHAFIRIFKKLENITPGKYRELCENNDLHSF